MLSLLDFWQSLSAELQGAVVGGIGGSLVGGAMGGILTIVGVVAGAMLERSLRRQGKVRHSFVEWNLVLQSHPPSFSFIAKFFNEKDLDIGLRDLRVVFYRGKAEMVSAELYFGFEAGLYPDGQPGDARHREYTGLRAEAINLPSGQWLSRPLIGRVSKKEDQDKLQPCDRVVFRGYLPKGNLFETERKPFRAGNRKAVVRQLLPVAFNLPTPGRRTRWCGSRSHQGL
jgi:hypothetical protein